MQTLPVPAANWTAPSPLWSHSWTLRARGVVASQRQTAPFAPRSGHVHAVLQLHPAGSNYPVDRQWPRYIHLIVGGADLSQSRYYNDAWLYLPGFTSQPPNLQATRNGQWFSLPAAPFSPRSDMLHHVVEDGQWDRWEDHWQGLGELSGMPGVGGRQGAENVFIGGQSGHACSQPALGRCENDIWSLRVEEDAGQGDTGGLRLSWSDDRAVDCPSRAAVGWRLSRTAECSPASSWD